MDTEKQGNLGDLRVKTRQELEDLVKRQEKLLSDIKFLNKLPDKGVKIKTFVGRLKTELDVRKDIDSAADLFHEMTINAEKANRERGLGNQIEEDMEKDCSNPLESIVNRASNEKQVIDERKNPNNFTASYEKIIKKKAPASTKKFFPHKTIKTENVEDFLAGEHLKKDVVTIDIPTSMEQSEQNVQLKKVPSKSDKETKQFPITEQLDVTAKKSNLPSTHLGLKSENPKLKHRYDDSLEMSIYAPSRKYGGAKLISIEDSIETYQIQKKKQETEYAGKKLAEKLGIKMTEIDASKQSMLSYRVFSVESGDDSEAEIDYPD